MRCNATQDKRFVLHFAFVLISDGEKRLLILNVYFFCLFFNFCYLVADIDWTYLCFVQY